MTKELKAAAKKLTPENKKIIKKMRLYLGTYFINEVCFQDLISDIIGMALETQERGESFADTVGMDYEQFCRELVKNVPRQTAVEQSLDWCIWVFYCVGLTIPLLFLLGISFPNYLPIECSWPMFRIPVPYLTKYMLVVLVLVLGRTFVKRSAYKSQTVVFGIYVAAVLLVIAFSDYIPIISVFDKTLEINVLIWTIGFLILVALGFALKKIKALYEAGKNNK